MKESFDLSDNIGSVVNSCDLNFSRKMVFTDQGVGILVALKKSGEGLDKSSSFAKDESGVKYFDFKAKISEKQGDIVACHDCSFDPSSKTYVVICSRGSPEEQ